MRTGYTVDIKEGITFKEFALCCARAFGARVTLRDKPLGAPIPDEFTPSDYHIKEQARLRKELSLIGSLAPEECEEEAKREYGERVEYCINQIKKCLDLKHKYQNMLKEVNSWTPPTPDHQELKDFMAKQILESIELDCDVKYWDHERGRVILLSGSVWATQQVDRLVAEIKCHEKKYAEEVDRINSRNQWINDLRNSLNQSE